MDKINVRELLNEDLIKSLQRFCDQMKNNEDAFKDNAIFRVDPYLICKEYFRLLSEGEQIDGINDSQPRDIAITGIKRKLEGMYQSIWEEFSRKYPEVENQYYEFTDEKCKADRDYDMNYVIDNAIKTYRTTNPDYYPTRELLNHSINDEILDMIKENIKQAIHVDS